MTCDVDRLTAYRDGELPDEAVEALEAHLSSCPACRAALEATQARRDTVRSAMTALDPPEAETPSAADAWRALRATAAETETDRPWWRRWYRSDDMRNESGGLNRRAAAAMAAAAIVMVLLLFVAPVRQVAADVLSLFRVREFEVVQVTESRAEQLTAFEEALNSGLLGEPDMLREPTAPELVADSVAASDTAGFEVRQIAGLPEGVTLEETRVAVGPHVRLDIERDVLAMGLLAAGIEDVTLPDADAFPVEIDIPALVQQQYDVEGVRLDLVQVPSPSLSLPQGIPPETLGQAYLQFLGTPSEEAAAMAKRIDWTSTLVIPIPEDLARYQDVSVSGAPGLLLHSTYSGQQQPESLLMWQRDDIVYALSGRGVASSLLVRAAESVQ